MIGQRVSHYEILSALGAGGMGEVYKALDTRLNRPVALKFLLADPALDADHRRRLLHEAQAASALNHPNIIAIYEVGSVDGRDFIVMEFVAGRPLDQLIGTGGLKLGDVLKYAIQIADAMASAHAAGIVHRDLKPANVMVTDKGLVKVLDFGLAKLVDLASDESGAAEAVTREAPPRTEAGMLLGTVAYMSPEQAEGKRVDARSDIFAFGSLLYEMVTGRRAFAGETKVATLSAILSQEPQPASEITEAVPPELDRIIAHCLRKDPDRRFQHLDDVNTLLQHLRKEPSSGQLAREARHKNIGARMRTRPVAAAVLLVIAAVVAGLWWWGWRGVPGAAGGTAMPPPTAQARSRLSSGGPASGNAEANRLFENAMQLKVVNDLARSRLMLERALVLDPRFAEARAWYGFTHWLLVDAGIVNDAALLNNAEEEMRRALQDEPTLARAHAGFAAVYMAQGRTELVPREVELALAINPADEDALSMLFLYHQYRDEYPAARRVGAQVLDRIPLFFPVRMTLGEVMRQQGDPEGAIREQEKILEQDSQNVYALAFLARAHMDAGDLRHARQSLNRLRPDDRRNFRTRRTWALLLALEGRRTEALQEMDEDVLKWEALVAYETSEVADFYAVLGDAPKALDWLDRAARNGDERAEWFRRDPLLVGVRNHPRFEQIMQSITYRRQQRKSGQ